MKRERPGPARGAGADDSRGSALDARSNSPPASGHGAILLILEMDRPFAGLLQISEAPLRGALQALHP